MPREIKLALPDDLDQFVGDETRRRGLASPGAFVEELLRDRFRDHRRAALEAALDRGLADAEAGRTSPIDEASARLRRSLSADHDRKA
jgi:antitoxin ParD1/3/4